MDFAFLVGERWLAGLIIGLVVVAFLFAFDLLLLFRNRDFGFVRVSFLTVLLKESGDAIDMLQFVGADIKVRLNNLLQNRFLLWRVLWAAFRLPQDHLILDLGKQADDVMELIRYQLDPLNRSGLVKEAANRKFPGTFKTARCELLYCFVYHAGVLKVWLVHREDLANAEKYRKSQTNRQAQNRNILFELARAYKETPERFIPFTLVAG
ncbi:MAG TPA: hypothetical protein VHD38_01680 [Candidatus Paceibacterota bacterium]|jgi:hypothetical protein|nr:hypothetical protein [Candidatus Paceibacterota bacterium]